MKAILLDKYSVAGLGKRFTFHKGRKYDASPAVSIPNQKEQGLYFLTKKSGGCILLSTVRGEIKIEP